MLDAAQGLKCLKVSKLLEMLSPVLYRQVLEHKFKLKFK